jgi:hypothetical protein
MSKQIVSDFAAFDNNPNALFTWFANSRSIGTGVLVVSRSHYRAREAASVVLQCDREFMKTTHAEGKTVIALRTTVVFAGEAGKFEVFKTTRDTSCERVGRAENLRKWEWLDRQGGRDNEGVAGRMQEDSVQALSPDARSSSSESATRSESRETVGDSGRDSKS